MIKTVLVDDERPALRELEFLLKKYPKISVIGTYTNPLAAINDMGRLKPQVVFLDINMPQLQGIDAASRILEESPDTEIIFVTAFDQYAVEAFELHALDYILKPIDMNRFNKTIERVMKKRSKLNDSEEKRLYIRCLGRFEITWENQKPIKWRAEKTKELFAFLLQNRERDISKDELLDKLWPEDDPEKAIRQLYNGVYYIRKALEEYGIERSLISIGSSYNLRLGRVDFDIVRFHDLNKVNGTRSIEQLEALIALYTGDYLEGEYYSWADFERENLSKLHMRCLLKLSSMLLEEKQWDRAENHLVKAYNITPYDEDITELLLRLYLETGNRSKAVRHFNTYSELLKNELGIKPHEKLQSMMKF